MGQGTTHKCLGRKEWHMQQEQQQNKGNLMGGGGWAGGKVPGHVWGRTTG